MMRGKINMDMGILTIREDKEYGSEVDVGSQMSLITFEHCNKN